VADEVDMLNFQKLDVYRCAVEFLALSVDLPAELPRGHSALADQLRRAALSVPLNIAEGSGRPSAADSSRHYGIARGSAMECAAIIDAFQILGVLDAPTYHSAISLLERTVAMLTKICRPPP
jgi:four helix bundle protein